MDLITYGATTTGSLSGVGIANGTKKDMTLTENGLHDATEVQEHMAIQVQTGTVLMGKGENMMVDREKVIGHLYDCLAASRPENMWVFVRKDIIGDALAILKEQQQLIDEITQRRANNGAFD